MLRIRITDQRDGSHRLFVAGCRTVEYDLDDAAALVTIREYARQKPFPRSWNDDEIIRRVRDAEGQCRRGQALEVDAEGCIALGGRDPQSGRLVISPKKTLPTAEAYVRDFHLHPEGRAVQCYAGLLMEWQDNRYREVEDNAVKKRLQVWLHESLRYIFNRRTEELELVRFRVESQHDQLGAGIDSGVHAPARYGRLSVMAGRRAARFVPERDAAVPFDAVAPADDAALSDDTAVLHSQRPRI